jgi:hypothetical protein
MQLNYETFKNLSLKVGCIVGAGTAIYAVTTLAPAILMQKAAITATLAMQNSLGPLAPYCSGMIANAGIVASGEAYLAAKATGYLGWTAAAVTKATGVGAIVGGGIAKGLFVSCEKIHSLIAPQNTSEIICTAQTNSTVPIPQEKEKVESINQSGYVKHILKQQKTDKTQLYLS